MKTQRNILVAFILNIVFCIFELLGGLFTNSISIISDSIHDFGDSISIGLSYFLEKKSKRNPDDKYTYGYIRYSTLGAFITTMILFIGSLIVIYNSIFRIINPVEINYDGMLIIAIIGVVINFVAAYYTREGDSLNQKSVNLHMLEDVLGWVVVLVGSILIKLTKVYMIDSILSLLVATYILMGTLKNLKAVLELFLEKAPNNISLAELKHHLLNIDGVEDVHHIHLWSLDGFNNYATMHVICDNKHEKDIKCKIREELQEHGIMHVTIETENEKCDDVLCTVKSVETSHHHHHHH